MDFLEDVTSCPTPCPGDTKTSCGGGSNFVFVYNFTSHDVPSGMSPSEIALEAEAAACRRNMTHAKKVLDAERKLVDEERRKWEEDMDQWLLTGFARLDDAVAAVDFAVVHVLCADGARLVTCLKNEDEDSRKAWGRAFWKLGEHAALAVQALAACLKD